MEQMSSYKEEWAAEACTHTENVTVTVTRGPQETSKCCISGSQICERLHFVSWNKVWLCYFAMRTLTNEFYSYLNIRWQEKGLLETDERLEIEKLCVKISVKRRNSSYALLQGMRREGCLKDGYIPGVTANPWANIVYVYQQKLSSFHLLGVYELGLLCILCHTCIF